MLISTCLAQPHFQHFLVVYLIWPYASNEIIILADTRLQKKLKLKLCTYLKELIPMIPHTTYKEDYKCVKEIEIDHLNYLEMFHFQSKNFDNLRQNKIQPKMKKERMKWHHTLQKKLDELHAADMQHAPAKLPSKLHMLSYVEFLAKSMCSLHSDCASKLASWDFLHVTEASWDFLHVNCRQLSNTIHTRLWNHDLSLTLNKLLLLFIAILNLISTLTAGTLNRGVRFELNLMRVTNLLVVLLFVHVSFFFTKNIILFFISRRFDQRLEKCDQVWCMDCVCQDKVRKKRSEKENSSRKAQGETQGTLDDSLPSDLFSVGFSWLLNLFSLSLAACRLPSPPLFISWTSIL
ncbi:hypothetical protein VP01_3723g1 [Puccinia sorghi]|uniref:Uncharacterized protein n=1 Tax=Puccinia sorghi TaxID=27349 RepID=A0A0L6UUU9_9BASI|nr:hypothetical protein VP01_3723g1 [Puccinia sorghi]